MNKQELLSLRGRILGDITPLVLESAEAGADRFALLLRLIQAGNATGDIYKKAYESAKMIEDKDDQLDALLSLVDEIDFDVNRQEAVSESPAEAESDTSTDSQLGTSAQNSGY
jgi:hypothetical protein